MTEHTTRLSLLMSCNIPEDHARELIAAYEKDPNSNASAIPRSVFARFVDPESDYAGYLRACGVVEADIDEAVRGVRALIDASGDAE